MNTPLQLIDKYNVAVPRYTSYPTVPYWDNDNFSLDQWKKSVKFSFDERNEVDGISAPIRVSASKHRAATDTSQMMA